MRMREYGRVVGSLLLAAAPLGCSGFKTAQTAVTVTDIDVGRSVAADKTIADQTDAFRPADTFYVSVKTDGSGPTATLTAGKWSTRPGRTSPPRAAPPSASSTCPSQTAGRQATTRSRFS
jgi:hypothetical protein